MSMERTVVHVHRERGSVGRQVGLFVLLGGYMIYLGVGHGVEWAEKTGSSASQGAGRLLRRLKGCLGAKRLVKEIEIHLRQH